MEEKLLSYDGVAYLKVRSENTPMRNGDYFPDRYFLDSYDDWYYWEKIEDAAKHVSGIVGYEVEPTVEAIDDALENYQQEHENEELFYSFHEFKVVDD